MVVQNKPKPASAKRYRWPAYLSEGMRDKLKFYLLRRRISFSEWVRRHAERDMKGKP